MLDTHLVVGWRRERAAPERLPLTAACRGMSLSLSWQKVVVSLALPSVFAWSHLPFELLRLLLVADEWNNLNIIFLQAGAARFHVGSKDQSN